jgi:hypothetical protein
MPEPLNQVSSGQRRANWVALRTLRQLPKAVGETAGGEQIYEVRSVPLLLDSAAGHFVRLAECARCGRQLAGAPVLTTADLDRPLRPMICADCIRGAGVSTVWEQDGGEPAEEPAAPGERPAPALPASESAVTRPPDPPPTPAEVKQPERLQILEGHLRAVTDRVNELGRITRSHQADLKERAQREEGSAALRDELAALRAASEDVRAEMERLAGAQAELERGQGRGDTPAPAEAGAGLVQLREEVAQLARLVEAQRGEVIGFVTAVGETQRLTSTLSAAHEALAEKVAGWTPADEGERIAARLAEVEGDVAEALARPPAEADLSKVEELISTRLAEVEGRLTDLIARQWGDIETAIAGTVKAYMAGFERASKELIGGQSVLEERIDALADQVIEASRRLDAVRERVAVREAVGLPAPAQPPRDVPSGSFLDNLDRQLDAAARRLASRSQAGAGGADQ